MFCTDPHCPACLRALVNPNESHFPGYVCRHLGNYIVARPYGYRSSSRNKNKKEKKKHAEEFLLDKKDILISNYTQHHGKPQLIVLYSWLMPCFSCTTRIINAFKNNSTKVIVAYSSHSQAKDMKWDKKRLEQASITVIRVKYNHPLPPIH